MGRINGGVTPIEEINHYKEQVRTLLQKNQELTQKLENRLKYILELANMLPKSTLLNQYLDEIRFLQKLLD